MPAKLQVRRSVKNKQKAKTTAWQSANQRKNKVLRMAKAAKLKY